MLRRFLSIGRESSKGVCFNNELALKSSLLMSHLSARCNVDENSSSRVNELKELELQRKSLLKEFDNTRHSKRELGLGIEKMVKEKCSAEMINEKKSAIKKESMLINDKAAALSSSIHDVENGIKSLLSALPNLLDDRVPDGISEDDNVILSTWEGSCQRKVYPVGSPSSETGPNPYLWHDEIASSMHLLDKDLSANMSGARFSVLFGSLAELERSLIQYFIDFFKKKQYSLVSVPYIVSRGTLEGTGHLPKFEDDLFKVNHSVKGEDAFLIPTAEVPCSSLYAHSTLNHKKLPMKIMCHSPSFRAEAGGHGRDVRGLLRQHQFHKVELVKICDAASSTVEHEQMCTDVEELLQSLQLPYRKKLLCSADIGFAARICYDLEVWYPGQQEYREISSISNCEDFQSFRMGCRSKPSPHAKASPVHTINGSGVAVGRALAAILENYQEEDGRVLIPQVLQGPRYMNCEEDGLYLTPAVTPYFDNKPSKKGANEGSDRTLSDTNKNG